MLKRGFERKKGGSVENEVQRQRAKHPKIIGMGVLILQQQALQLMTDCLLYVCKSIELGDRST